MATEFKQTETSYDEVKKSGYNKTNNNFLSKITENIGTGDDAKNSLIYLTLKWAFISGIVITTLIVINHWAFRLNEKIPDFMSDIKIAWEILIPIITLALGYAFGKSHK
jgi:hypothetical protein